MRTVATYLSLVVETPVRLSAVAVDIYHNPWDEHLSKSINGIPAESCEVCDCTVLVNCNMVVSQLFWCNIYGPEQGLTWPLLGQHRLCWQVVRGADLFLRERTFARLWCE